MNFLLHLTGGGSTTPHPSHGRSTARSHFSLRSSRESSRVHADSTPPSASPTARRGQSSASIGVGAAIIMLNENAEQQTLYHAGGAQTKDGKPLLRDHFFITMLAPDADSALAFLSSQPAGSYVLVKDGDEIAVYVKFHQAVRVHALVRAKDAKKQKEVVFDWGRAYCSLEHTGDHAEALTSQPTLMTPVHRVYLPLDAYQYVERCWRRFLPQLQSIVFELCSEPYYKDEETVVDDWGACILSARSPCVAFLEQDACGFFLFNTTAIMHDAAHFSSSSSVASTAAQTVASVPVRHVEFDFAKCLVSIADGAFRPSAFVVATHFGPKKYFEPELTFAMIRENLLSPELVALKEASATTHTTQPAPGSLTIWQDFSIPSADSEAALLSGALAVCHAMIPHEPLPDGFLDSVRDLHAHLARNAEAQRERLYAWSPDKNRLVALLLPCYVEIFLATADTAEHVASELRASSRKNWLPSFANAVRFDILYMARRVDQGALARLAHRVLQALAMRAELPAGMVSLVSDLFAALPHFRTLFLRHQGAAMLWTAIHSATVVVEPVGFSPLPAMSKSRPAAGELNKRRSSLFGMRRKSNMRSSRMSLDFNASLSMLRSAVAKSLIFFRLNPLMVQLELALQLREHHFGATSSSIAPLTTPESASPYAAQPPSPTTVLSAMIVFITRMAHHLMADPASVTWERDVTQLLRMDDLYERLHREIVRSLTDSVGSFVGDDASACLASLDTTLSGVALDPRFEAAVECITTLFRLETKRRRISSFAMGEKKFWFLFHLLRTPIRDFHEQLRDRIATGDSTQSEGHDTAGGENGAVDEAVAPATALRVLTVLLPRLPRQLLTEFVLVSLDDLLRLLAVLNEYVERAPAKLPVLLRHLRDLVAVLGIVLRRTSDIDLQLLLLRIAASSGSSIPAVLQLLVNEAARVEESDAPLASAIQVEVLTFVDAFVHLSIALVQTESWNVRFASGVQSATHENRDDVECNEQRKTMLMATVLSPENGVAESEEVLWGVVQSLLLLPSSTANKRSGLRVVERFLSRALACESETSVADRRSSIALAYLRLRARLYTSALVEAPAVASQLRSFVDFHWEYVANLRSRYAEQAPSAERAQCRELMEAHLVCLLALVSRRELSPALDAVIIQLNIARRLLSALDDSPTLTPGTTTANSEDSGGVTPIELLGNSDGRSSDGPSKADESRGPMPSLNLNLSRLDGSSNKLATTVTVKTPELLLSHAKVHATTLMLVMSCLVRDADALDERLVPRFFIPDIGSGYGGDGDDDLLWKLQRHLAALSSKEVVKAMHAAVQELGFQRVLGSPARVEAVFTLTRLLTPDSFEWQLYSEDGKHDPHDLSDDEDEDAARAIPPSYRRAYIAKGAFAAVYRATPPRIGATTSSVAIKVLAHQKRSGDLCVAADLFNEVCVLRRLRGTPAATQLLDYGSRSDSESFEIVMDHCPSTLSEWRRSLSERAPTHSRLPSTTATGTAPPFRTLLCMTLSVFSDVCHALGALHGANVCHFDVKADNVLVRIDRRAYTAELLRALHPHSDSGSEATASGDGGLLTGRTHVCFGDFGESVLITATTAASASRDVWLSRTRGTEAIKSPEMLGVKGSTGRSTESTNENAHARVGPASDVWSLGCLLYELVTEELMFGFDEWAELYAHVVASSAPIVRDDHRRKLVAALRPETDAERGLADIFIQFIASMLVRAAASRPTLEQVEQEAQMQLRMIVALPSRPQDEQYIASVLGEQSTAAAPPVSSPSGSSAAALARISYPVGPPVVGRLFWNLYLARGVDALLGTSGERCDSDASVGTARQLLAPGHHRSVLHALSVLQLRHEANFSHFIYFCFDETKGDAGLHSTGDRSGNNDAATTEEGVHPSEDTSHHEFLEIVEGVGRTLVYVHRARLRACLRAAAAAASSASSSAPSSSSPSTSTPSLVTLLLQYSRGLLPALQRRLRFEPTRVLCVPLTPAPSSPDGRALRQLTSTTLLYFLIAACALSPLQALSAFSRECAAVMSNGECDVDVDDGDHRTHAALVQQLVDHHGHVLAVRASVASTERLQHSRRVALCRCGDKVLAVALATWATATAWPLNDASSSSPSTYSATDADADVVCDFGDAERVHGATRGPRAGWRVVDSLQVERLESQLRVVLQTQLGVAATTANAGHAHGHHHAHLHQGMRRRSLNLLAPRHPHGHGSATASVREHVPFLIHGLGERRDRDADIAGTSAAWTAYECGMCGACVCAVSANLERIALPPVQAIP